VSIPERKNMKPPVFDKTYVATENVGRLIKGDYPAVYGEKLWIAHDENNVFLPISKWSELTPEEYTVCIPVIEQNKQFCPVCTIGTMSYTGMCYYTNPLQYEHVCDTCNHKCTYNKEY
jgi:hypothetical protein